VFPRGAGFDWTTLGINMAGRGLIGMLMTDVTENPHAPRLTGPFLGVGMLSGFTTFSTYIIGI
jgi:CrcB protein